MHRKNNVIFLISDIHSDIDKFDKHIASIQKTAGRALDSRDIVICLGDLLGQSSRKAPSLQAKLAADRKFLHHLQTQPFSLASVMGNHDDKKRLRWLRAKRQERFGEEGSVLAGKVFYFDNGKTYDIPLDLSDQGAGTVRIMALGGAFGHMYRFHRDDPYKIQNAISQYLSLIHATRAVQVDYVLSHDVPSSKAGKLVQYIFGLTPINNCLDAIEDSLVFHEWYFGHHHFDLDPHPRFHGLYRRQVGLEKPSENAEPFNVEAVKHRGLGD